eukprot:g17099.t1
MAEDMTFLPKRDLLTLEELDRLCSAFIARGVRKLRLTGGEPLVRKNVMGLVESLSRHLQSGALEELTVTTNGSQLAKYAEALYRHGVRRVNVSMDTLDPDKFKAITRWGELARVMEGIDAAQAAGLHVKINAVALRDFNDDEIATILEWAHGRGMELTLIETMPLGEIDGDRTDQYLPLDEVRSALSKQFTLTDLPDQTGGPARYVRVEETGQRLGFITPLTHNFCESCNRVRITCTAADLPISQFIALRGIAALIFILILGFATGAVKKMPKATDRAVGLRTAGEIGATLLYYNALTQIPIANANAVLQVIPLAVTAAAALLLGEKVTYRSHRRSGIPSSSGPLRSTW